MLDPAAVAVPPFGVEHGCRPRHTRRIDPRFRNDLPAVGAAAMQIQLAQCDHLFRREQHLVATEVDALWILGPARECESERTRKRVVRELPGARAGGPG